MISIIIPVYNEAATVEKLIRHLLANAENAISEIIVSDAGSTDDTITLATNAGATVVRSPQKGRAIQMNFGASFATGDILYFIHADCFPPTVFTGDIQEAVRKGFGFGRYKTKFDSNKILLHLNAVFTRFDLFVCYGGDQTLFITKILFDSINGFDETMRIMEDYDIVTRAKLKARYKIMRGKALISARKFHNNSWIKVQIANYTIVKMYQQGASQQAMAEKYRQLLRP